MRRLWVAIGLAILGCATPASEVVEQAEKAQARELAECTAQMEKIVNPYAGRASQGCFERWATDGCRARAEQIYWETARGGARGRLLKTSREALARMPEKKSRVDEDYKLCLAYAERGTS